MAVPSPLGRRPTVAAMLVLTAVTGLVDMFSYFELGHVFVAYMTGNIIFLGVGLQPGAPLSAVPSAVAVSGFVLGSLTGGRAAARLSHRPRRWLATALATEAALLALVALLVGTGAVASVGSGAEHAGGHRPYGVIALLALAAGLQNSTVRHFGVRDLNTAVLTLTLTGLTADSALAGGPGARPHRRLGSVAAMLGGAAAGAAVLRVSATAVLVLAALLVALVCAAFAADRNLRVLLGRLRTVRTRSRINLRRPRWPHCAWDHCCARSTGTAVRARRSGSRRTGPARPRCAAPRAVAAPRAPGRSPGTTTP